MTKEGGRRKEERNEGERDEHFVVPHVQHLVYRTLRSAVSSSTSPLLYFSCTTSSYLHNRIVVPSSIVAHIHRRPVERERDRRERTQCTSVTTFLAHNRKIKHELVLFSRFLSLRHLHTFTSPHVHAVTHPPSTRSIRVMFFAPSSSSYCHSHAGRL